MEISPYIFALIIITLLVVPPVVLFRPLVNSIADRIAGKRPGAKELSDLEKRVAMLEGEMNDMRSKYEAIEESQEFSRKLLEDIHFNGGESEVDLEKLEERLEDSKAIGMDSPNPSPEPSPDKG